MEAHNYIGIGITIVMLLIAVIFFILGSYDISEKEDKKLMVIFFCLLALILFAGVRLIFI